MRIFFSTKKLQKLCNEDSKAQKQLGKRCAGILRIRLDDLLDADSLAIYRLVDSRCHPLKGSREGQYAVDLEHPRRLIFVPADDPLPVQENGGIDESSVESIRILEIVDYH